MSDSLRFGFVAFRIDDETIFDSANGMYPRWNSFTRSASFSSNGEAWKRLDASNASSTSLWSTPWPSR